MPAGGTPWSPRPRALPYVTTRVGLDCSEAPVLSGRSGSMRGMRGGTASQFAAKVEALTRRRIEIFDDAGDDWLFAESLKSISEDTAQEYEGRALVELIQNGHDALKFGPGRI